MIKLLLKLGVDPNTSYPPIESESPSFDSSSTLERAFNYHPPLVWVLRQEPNEHISKEQVYSIARLLLENGANPDSPAVQDVCCPDGTSLLSSCIRHYDVEAVRLLLLHEADASDIDLPLVFQIKMREQEVDRSGKGRPMSHLLMEHGIQTNWERNKWHPELLVLHSLSLGTIAAPPVGDTVGLAFRRTISWLFRDDPSVLKSQAASIRSEDEIQDMRDQPPG
jgi:hypothetical protein